MKRVKYVVANWKMNGDSSSIKLVKSLDLFIKRKTKKLLKLSLGHCQKREKDGLLFDFICLSYLTK